MECCNVQFAIHQQHTDGAIYKEKYRIAMKRGGVINQPTIKKVISYLSLIDSGDNLSMKVR